MSIDNMTDEEVLKLREALSIKASVVISTPPEEVEVSIVGDGSDRLRIQFGNVSIFLSNFSAEALARDLIQNAVKLQYTLEYGAEGKGSK